MIKNTIYEEWNKTVSIPELPIDDIEYIVKRHGLVRKNPSPDASVYLVEVHLVSLDSTTSLTIEIILTHLYVLRLGSVWKNQKLVHEYYCEERNNFKMRRTSLFLNNTNPPLIKLLTVNKTTGKKRIIGVEGLSPEEDEVLSVFTVFVEPDGTQVFIPSLEILLSTYVPNTHSILHDIMVLSIDDVVKKHVRDCTVKGEYNDEYDAKFKTNYFIGTKFFLAYLSCNENTRRSVSKIRSSLAKNEIMRGSIKYSFLEAYPYHPDEFNIKALGLYDVKNKRYWVHQIEEYGLPECCHIPYDKRDKPKKKTEQRTQRRLNNEDVVQEDLDLTSKTDAGKNAGKKYIKSNVKVNVPWHKLYDTELSPEEPASLTGEVEACDPIAAAATPLSGQEASKPIAAVEYKNDDGQKGYFKILLEIIDELKEEVYFLTNEAIRVNGMTFCTLPKKKPFKGGYSNWALISKDRPRKLLFCEICLINKYVYILDIERKKKDSYAGIMFNLTCRADKTLLKQIKDVISINQGRFSGDERRKKFPVDNYKTFRHYSEKSKMENSIRTLIEIF